MKPLIAIVGPTASGKSDLAIKLAKKFNGEILSADSRTIYKGMDIGTAKPYIGHPQDKILYSHSSVYGSIYKIDNIPHYLLDVVKPNETFTVAQFQEAVYKIIKDILKRKKLPFLVGGTGLYIEAVTKGLLIPRVSPDPILREKLEKRSCQSLHKELKKLDPLSALKINPNNKRRIIRALEVCLITGKAFSKQQKIKKPPYQILTLGIRIPREKLYEKINKRVDEQIKMGLVKEVKNLLKKGYSLDLPPMSGLGYKQIGNWLLYKKPKSLKEAVYQIKRDSRHFARRQISWFKRDKNIKWIKNKKEAERLINKFLIAK